jgi:hypothetical protein
MNPWRTDIENPQPYGENEPESVRMNKENRQAAGASAKEALEWELLANRTCAVQSAR